MSSSFLPISRAVLHGTYRFVSGRGEGVPRPDEAAHGTAGAADGFRLLLVGNEYAISWGVRIQELALSGQLARQVSQRSGSGAEVDVISDPGLSITDVLGRLTEQDLVVYDAVVVITGIGDAYTLLPPVRWVVQMKHLLERLLASTSASTPVTVVGIQPASSVNFLKVKEHGAVDRWAQALNELTEGLCGRYENVHYVPAPEAESGNLDDTDRLRFKSPAVYQAWGSSLAKHLLPFLVEPLAQTAEKAAVHDGVHRTRALQALGLDDETLDARFTPVVRRALNLFQTGGAAFTVIGADHLVAKGALGYAGPPVAGQETFCATTITTSGPFVVEDAWKDSRVTFDTPIRFYAGFPVVAPDGTRIGALCVFDSNPRSETTIDVTFLRELADEINQQLAELPIAVTDRAA